MTLYLPREDEEEEEEVLATVRRSELCSLSPVLGAWLGGGFLEASACRVPLPTEHFSPATWRVFLSYAQQPTDWTASGEADKGWEGGLGCLLVELLRLADVYCLEHLRRECERAVVGNMEEGEAGELMEVLAVARGLSAAALEEHCLFQLTRRYRRQRAIASPKGEEEVEWEDLPMELREKVERVVRGQQGLGLEHRVAWTHAQCPQ